MFPNKIQPLNGVFVKERIRYIAKHIDVSVVAPVPFFPLLSYSKKYRNIHRIPFREQVESLMVYHPKYLLIPKYLKFFDGYCYFLSLNEFFSRTIRDNNIDLLDFHWVYPDAFAGVRWAKKLGKKIVITIRGNESICYFEKSLRKKMLIRTLKTADHIIAVSNDMEKKIVDEYGVCKRNVTVIRNGIDKNKFYQMNKNKAKKDCEFEADRKYILSLCRLSKEKGIEYLLKAFSNIVTDKVNLIIAGEGPLLNVLQLMTRKLKIEKSVKFIGEIKHEDACKWYNASDVYCLPSLWEGCPNTIIESLACGTPVVSTLVGGIPDLVDKKTGILVPSKNVELLSNALEVALNRKWDYSAIASQGQSNSWDDVADRVIEVYKKVLL